MLPPPPFPDVVHVANGCYISAVAYLARFRTAFPREKGAAVPIVLANSDGGRRPHTVAIVSWRGRWWARDEYYGVIDLREAAARRWNEEAAARRLERAFAEREARRIAAGESPRQPDRPPPGARTADWRLEQIGIARKLLPVESQVLWQRSGEEVLPFLFFRERPAGGSFAVYDPASGTAQAAAKERDPARLVAAVAGRLGYAAPAEFPLPAAVAGNFIPEAGNHRRPG